MANNTGRTLAGIDISVLDHDTVTVETLRADADRHPITVAEQTVSELYTAAAAAEVERLCTGLAEYDHDDVLVQGSAAFIDAAAVLRCLADKLGDREPSVRDRWARLAENLTREAGALTLAADQLTGGRDR